MANTLIQIKRSTTSAIPSTLNVAEPAYSYVSNTLFLGTSDGAGVIPIGGKYYTDKANTALDTAILAFQAANSAIAGEGIADAAYDKANSANVLAYESGIIGSNAYDKANSANIFAYTTSIATTASFDAANAAFLNSNTAYNAANAAFLNSNTAFDTANNALPRSGGTITGDLVVQGNTVFSGTTTYANTQTLLIGDNIFVVNADLPSDVGPSENAGFEVNRGSSANVSLLWDESTDKWTFTNDGTNYLNIASTSDVSDSSAIAVGAYVHANAAYTHANSAYGQANTAYDAAVAGYITANAAFLHANTGYAAANAAFLSSNSAYVAANAAFLNSNSAFDKANTADINAANASFINTGTLAVSFGGTGAGSFTTNGVLYGNGTGAINVSAAGSEGQVLTVAASGAPQFSMLDGGSF